MERLKTFPAYLHTEFTTHQKDEEAFSRCNFLNSIIVPRPIAFITTKSSTGMINAAPFSYFNAVSAHPPIISISIERRKGQRKDTCYNIFSTKEFVINICSVNLADAVSHAGKDYPSNISEVDLTGLSLLPSEKISVPRIANTPIQMECILKKSIEVIENQVDLILGEVIAIHLHKSILNEQGRVDFEKLNPLARFAGNTYGRITYFFDA